MSVLKKVFLVTIFIISISFSFCYAIDENQLSTNPSANTSNMLDNVMSINTEENLTNSTNTYEEETPSTISTSASIPETTSSESQSTTISNVSSSSKTSTISNIINIALIVVGVLLIFLAIAILIRLNS